MIMYDYISYIYIINIKQALLKMESNRKKNASFRISDTLILYYNKVYVMADD